MVTTLNGTAVLVTDDDVENLDGLSFLIAHEGATVRTARSAREALNVLRTWTPDVILLDVSLPDMDGCDLLAAIRREPTLREVPAVAVTGLALARDRARCTEAGFAVHITKPFDLEALIGLIARLAWKPSYGA